MHLEVRHLRSWEWKLHRGISALLRDKRYDLSLLHVSAQQEGSHVQTMKWVLTRNQIELYPHLGLPSVQIVRNTFLLFKPSSLWYLMIAAHAGQENLPIPMKNVGWLPKDGSHELNRTTQFLQMCIWTPTQHSHSLDDPIGGLTNHPGLFRTKGSLGAKSVWACQLTHGRPCWREQVRRVLCASRYAPKLLTWIIQSPTHLVFLRDS